MSLPPFVSFEDIGLPNGHVCHRLAYHQAAGAVIAYTGPHKSRFPARRLFIRGIGDSSYRPIGEFPIETSISAFALSPTLPFLYFLTYAWEEAKGGIGANWDALYRVGLDSLQCEVVTRRGELPPLEGYKRAWFGDLLSVGSDERGVFCTAALLNSSGKVERWLSEFSLADLKFTLITRFATAFA
jgi:hypothetical protein